MAVASCLTEKIYSVDSALVSESSQGGLGNLWNYSNFERFQVLRGVDEMGCYASFVGSCLHTFLLFKRSKNADP